MFIQTGQSASQFSPDPLPTIQTTLHPGVEWVTVRSLPVEASTIWQEKGQVFAFSRPLINSAQDAALYRELLEVRLNSLPDEQVLMAEVTFKASLPLVGIESLLDGYTIISLLTSDEDSSTRQVAYPPEDVPAEFQTEFSQVYETLSGGTPAPSLSPDNYIAATVKTSALLLRELAQKERVFTVDVGPVDLVGNFPGGDFSPLKDVSYDYELHVGSVCEFTLLRNRINELSASGEIPVAVKDELNDLLSNAEIYQNANDVASARGEMVIFFETLVENSTAISEAALKETGVVGDCLVVREMQSDPVVDAGDDQAVSLGANATIIATYSDADNTENHSAQIDWGDGTIEDVPVNMTGPGTGDVTGEHSYSSPDDYTVEVCVTDLYGAVGCDSILVTVNSGFPSTGILDNFNRANGSIGSDWSGNTSGYNIASNQLSVDYSGSNSDIYWSNEPFGADQEAYVTITNVDGNAWEQDLLLKAQSNNTWGDGVLEVLYDPSGQRVQVWTYEWPAGWVQHGADIPVTFVDGDHFGARALADGTVEVYRNGELLAARDITSWSHYAAGGYIGLWFIGAENAVLDDFGGGTVLNGMQSMSMGGTIESQSVETSLTPEQLNVTLTDTGLFWQGVPIGSNQRAYVTFAQLSKDLATRTKPQSNGAWGEGIVQVLYDVTGRRIQVWMHDPQKGWVQVGADIPVKFAEGDTFSVRVLANGMVEIHRNGKLLVKRDVTP
jgi:hypothetical protein